MKRSMKPLFHVSLAFGLFLAALPAVTQAQDSTVKKVERGITKAAKTTKHNVIKTTRKAAKKTSTNAYRLTHKKHILCADGTWSYNNEGCNSHDGVAARQPEYKATTPKGTYAITDPTAATARCVDGTYWHSKSHVHACRGHGGVERWL